MRSIRVLAVSIAVSFSSGCGDDAGGSNGDAGARDGSLPGCESCPATLESETNLCSGVLQQCTSMPQSTEASIACFIDDGDCYDAALRRSATCHRQCGDLEQANVEECAGRCFIDRAQCSERAIRRADMCFDNCSDPQQCNLCEATGLMDFDACDATLGSCAEACVQTHRG